MDLPSATGGMAADEPAPVSRPSTSYRPSRRSSLAPPPMRPSSPSGVSNSPTFTFQISETVSKAIDEAARPATYSLMGAEQEADMDIKLYGSVEGAPGGGSARTDIAAVGVVLARRERSVTGDEGGGRSSVGSGGPRRSTTGTTWLKPANLFGEGDRDVDGTGEGGGGRGGGSEGVVDPTRLSVGGTTHLTSPRSSLTVPFAKDQLHVPDSGNADNNMVFTPHEPVPLPASFLSSATAPKSDTVAPDFVFVVSEGNTITEQGRTTALPAISLDRLRERDELVQRDVGASRKAMFNLQCDVDGLKDALKVCEEDEAQLDSVVKQLVSENLNLLQTLSTSNLLRPSHGERLLSAADRYSKEYGRTVATTLERQKATAKASKQARRGVGLGGGLAVAGLENMHKVTSRLAIHETMHRAASRVIGMDRDRGGSKVGSLSNSLNVT